MKFRFQFVLTCALSVALCACRDEATPVDPAPAAIWFEKAELSIPESSGKKVITLPLSNAFKQHGEIVIDFFSLTNDFALEPAANGGQLKLPVSRGQTFVSFSFTPLDNFVLNERGDEVVIFTLSSVCEGLLIDEKKSLKVTINDDELPAKANFLTTAESTRENDNEGIPVLISLSHNAPDAGVLTFVFESNDVTYGKDFITVPEAVNGRIDLSVESGAGHVSFKVFPLNDNLFNGNRNVTMKLASADGGVSRGDNNIQTLIIKDDELRTKTKGYTIGAGNWTYKKEYRYNLDGTLASARWEQATPGTTGGTYTYHYDSHGNLLRSTDNPVQETVYVTEANRITKSERIKNGELVEYHQYGYDHAGNVGEVRQYNRQQDGHFEMSLMFIYLYHTDGNVYKRLVYYPGESEDDFTLISTQTYENYLDVANPFTMVEILPNKKTMLTLPGSYRIEENGVDMTYNFYYDFDEEGRPIRRNAASGTNSEVTNYQYFD